MAVDLAVVNALVLAGVHYGSRLSLLSYPAHVLAICAGVMILLGLAKEGRPTIRSLVDSVKVLFVGTVFFYAIAFIYGAFVIRNARVNVAWSLWMASLTFLPARAIMGEECLAGWRRMLCKRRPDNVAEADLLFSTLGLLVGNWLACVVIPLDWGRDWQAWPVPNVLVGSVAFLMGSLLAHVLFRGSRLIPIVEVRSGSKRSLSSRSPTKAAAATPRKSAATRSGKSKSPRRAASPKRSPSPKRSTATPRTARSKVVEVEVPRTPRQGRPRSVSRTPRKVSPATSRSSSKSPRRSTRHA